MSAAGMSRRLALALLLVAAACGAVATTWLGGGAHGGGAGGATVRLFRPDSTQLSSCDAAHFATIDRLAACRGQALGNIAYRQGPQVAMAIIRQRSATDASFRQGCHFVAHRIGEAGFARFHGDVGQAFAAGSSDCVYGYLHGVLDHAFIGLSPAQVRVKLLHVCETPTIALSVSLRYACTHGVGHGLMLYFARDPQRVLPLCHGMAQLNDQANCAIGAFMELFATRTPQVLHEPWKLCSRYDGVWHRTSCAFGLGSAAVQHDEPATWTRAGDTCLHLRYDNARNSCFMGVGQTAAEVGGFQVQRVLDACSLATGDYRTTCFKSAAFVATHFAPAGGRAFCGALPIAHAAKGCAAIYADGASHGGPLTVRNATT